MGTGRCSRLAPYEPALHFHCATGLFVSPKDSRACCTPWSVFQDGSDEATYSQQSEAQSRRTRAAKETPTAHYRSSPRRRPPPRRETSGHEGLRWWVEATLSSVAGALRKARLYAPRFAPRGGRGNHPAAVWHRRQPTLASPAEECGLDGRRRVRGANPNGRVPSASP